jgi:hypothetical protein
MDSDCSNLLITIVGWDGLSTANSLSNFYTNTSSACKNRKVKTLVGSIHTFLIICTLIINSENNDSIVYYIHEIQLKT